MTASAPPYGRAPSPSALAVYAVSFAVAASAFCLAGWASDRLGGGALAVIGGATCGWSWLLTRALFRAPGPQTGVMRLWPLGLVLALVAANALLRLGASQAAPDFARVALNAESLVSSAMLLLAIVEPLKGVTPAMAAGERRFRFVYSAGYAALVAVAVVAANGSPQAGAIKTVCAALALIGMALTVGYRRRHPLVAAPAAAARKVREPRDDPEEHELAKRVSDLIQRHGAFADADLRVADLARQLGAPEYKVSQCISGALGFRNFNQMVNHFRIAEAKRRLADGANDRLPVLTIALDCGFGSIGPFNRAFKADTGMTPVEFRRAHSAAPDRSADGANGQRRFGNASHPRCGDAPT